MDCLPMGKIVGYHLSIDKFFYMPVELFHVFLKKELKNIPRPFSTVDLIVSCWSEQPIYHINALLKLLYNIKFNKIIFIGDHWQKNQYNLDYPIIYINFFVLQLELREQFLTKWNYDQHKGLLLTGKLGKLNRIGLLKKLYDNQLLLPNTLIWTVPAIQQQREQINSILSGNIDAFLDYCASNALDDPLTTYIEVCKFPWHDPYSVNEFFKLSNYSIVSETFFDTSDCSGSTEKTYRAILNKHPFIIAGSPGILQYLKNKGFKTFENYLPHPDYDSIVDHNLRLDAIVHNIAAFPQSIIDHKDQMAEDIEHNYILLRKIAQADRTLLENLYSKYNLSHANLNDNFLISDVMGFKNADDIKKLVTEIQIEAEKLGLETTKEADKLWLAKYNQIKSEAWPTINSKDEFNQLPASIQEECINDFNFNSES